MPTLVGMDCYFNIMHCCFKIKSLPFDFYQWRLRRQMLGWKPANAERQKEHTHTRTHAHKHIHTRMHTHTGWPSYSTDIQKEKAPCPTSRCEAPFTSKTLLSLSLCSFPLSWLLALPCGLSLATFCSCLLKALGLKVCVRAATRFFQFIILEVHDVIKYPATFFKKRILSV